jgi:hypothetical protein
MEITVKIKSKTVHDMPHNVVSRINKVLGALLETAIDNGQVDYTVEVDGKQVVPSE